jgi:hypothetical protein
MNNYSLEMSQALDNKITEIALRNGITKTQAIQRAIALLLIADEEKLKNNGSSLGVVQMSPDRKLQSVRLIDGV